MSDYYQYRGFDDDIVPQWENDPVYPFDLDLSTEQNEVEQNEEDILADVPPAALLADNHVDECRPGFNFSVVPPSRTNTEVVEDEGDLESAYNQHHNWTHAVISNTAPVLLSSPGSSAPPSVAEASFSNHGFISDQQCEKCQEVYKNPSLRKKHILKHVKPYKCTSPGCKRCEEGFATPNDLERHTRSVHKQGLQIWYKCAYPKCAKTNRDHFFDRKDNFIAHIKRRHEDLKPKEIESLVKYSEHHPTVAEVEAVLSAKGPGLSRANSAARAGGSRARKMKARSERSDDASSICSPSPIEASSATQPLDIPARAPAAPQSVNYSFGSINEIAGIGEGARMYDWTPHVNQGKGKEREVPMGNGQQNLQPRSAFAAHSFDSTARRPAHRWGPSIRHNDAPTSSPQQVFQAIPKDQYAGPRSFDSDLSAQLQDQRPASYPGLPYNFSGTMQDSYGRRQTQVNATRGGVYPGTRIRTTDLDNNAAFTASGSSQLFLSPTFDPSLQPPVYPDSISSSSPIDQCFGADSSAHQQSSVSSMSFEMRSGDYFNANFQDMTIDPKVMNSSFSAGNEDNFDEG